MKPKMIKKALYIFLLLFLGLKPAHSANYCATPPFLGSTPKPMIVFLMDFSGSMQFPAYYDCNFSSPYYYFSYGPANCGSNTDTYDHSNNYYGYFKSNKCYSYNSTNKYWEESSCDCSANNGIGNKDCLNGNFLNWAVTTRIDAALKALIGGKADCIKTDSNDNCLEYVLRPQGSRRYVRDTSLGCNLYVRPENYNSSSTSYPNKDVLISMEDISNSNKCKLGTFSDRYARVKISADERRGIIQDNFEDVMITFMVYGNYNDREGEVRYAFYQNSLDALINAFQNEVPYGGTPTGEAMYEVIDYLKQKNDHSYESNSSYIDRGDKEDPYYENVFGNLLKVPCRKSYVILISDGEWNGSQDPDSPSYSLHTSDLRDDMNTQPFDKQTADVFALFAFSTSPNGINSMKKVAAVGNFEDKDGCTSNYPYDIDSLTLNSLNENFPTPHCNPGGTYNDCCSEWDNNRDGDPDSFFSASEGSKMEKALRQIFRMIRSETSAGTAASILAQKRTQGAVVTQALFFPKKAYGDNDIIWTGNIYGYWYYVGKNVQNIREDSNTNLTLDVTNEHDYVIEFDIDSNTGNTIVHRYKSEADGTKGSELSTSPVQIEKISHLFKAGDLLRDVSGSDRTIYIEKDGSLVPFVSSNVIDDLLYLVTDNCLTTKDQLVSYIRGESDHGCRSRETDDDKIWKLGDIIYSTPKVVDYRDYSVMFVGANDGMLHAFKIGKIRKDGLSIDQKAKLCKNLDDDNCPNYNSSDLKEIGKELWAFIPKNVMPYLKYLADPDYCHMYFVDLSPYIIEEDTNKDGIIDKRILIGGLRFGGAAGCHKKSGDTQIWCSANQIVPEYEDCNPNNMSDCVGLSSYFALDITDPENPKFLWEFTDPYLGFSFSGPAYLKRGNYRYVMFVSGPTNYKGEADGQDLNIFIIGLESDFKFGGVLKIDGQGKEGFVKKSTLSEYNNAFGGRLFTEGIDADGDGKTDIVFFGVNQKTGTVWQGNVLGVKLTNDDDPSQWEIVQVFNSAIKPVTAKVEHMRCFNMNYIYFGTGRWFYKTDEIGQNDNDKEKLYGIRIDGCLQNNNCSLNSAHSNSNNACQALQDGDLTTGWTIDQDLLPIGSGYFKERNITDPTPINSRNSNIIVFTTMQPSGDLCGYGGRTRLWALNCATGANITDNSCGGYVPEVPEGKLLLQLSLGNIEEQKLSEITSKHTDWFTGIPPESATPFASGSLPIGRILLWLEK